MCLSRVRKWYRCSQLTMNSRIHGSQPFLYSITVEFSLNSVSGKNTYKCSTWNIFLGMIYNVSHKALHDTLTDESTYPIDVKFTVDSFNPSALWIRRDTCKPPSKLMIAVLSLCSFFLLCVACSTYKVLVGNYTRGLSTVSGTVIKIIYRRN